MISLHNIQYLSVRPNRKIFLKFSLFVSTYIEDGEQMTQENERKAAGRMLRAIGGGAVRLDDMNPAGMPDCFLELPDNRYAWVEFKVHAWPRAAQTTTWLGLRPQQRIWLAQRRRAFVAARVGDGWLVAPGTALRPYLASRGLTRDQWIAAGRRISEAPSLPELIWAFT